ncbi:MAG: SBBP repeat-containing protein [Clostridia bacterium]|nr:SBBP repeat-containing protein [Clostridia bacterium]
MKGKALIPVAILLVAAALLFTACNKQNDGKTGINVFVTDENGCTVLGPDGEPLTEEWITSVVYATDENGETYTNANGEKVTVKQTRPVVTSVVYHTYPLRDENGELVTDKNGETTMVNQTVVFTENVTNKDGSNVTQAVTDKDGNSVTKENGEAVTEVVTETRTENITHTVEITLEHQVTKHYTTKKSDKVTTTDVIDNPLYAPTTTGKDKPAIDIPEINIASTVDWLKGLGGKKNDKFVKVLPLGKNSFVALGNTESTDADFADFSQTGFYSFLAKYDADGSVKWICPIGTSGHTRMYDFAQLSDGSFIAVGESNAADLGYENAGKTYLSVIAKISADGNVQWYKHIGGTATDYFVAVTATPDGGFAAGGKFLSTDGDFSDLGLQGTDAVVAKFSASGTVEWAGRIGGAANETLRGIACDGSGNIYVTCHSNSKEYNKLTPVSQNVVTAKYSPSGSQLWIKTLEGSRTEEVNDIYADGSGCIIVGRYASPDGAFTVNRGGYDAYMARYSADGQLEWLRTYGGLENDTINSLAKTGFGYAAVGMTSSENRDFADIGNKGGTDGFILAINKDGEIEHVKSVAGTGNDSCNDICALDSKTFIIVGETYATDGALASVTPAAKRNNGTAFIGKYKIY